MIVTTSSRSGFLSDGKKFFGSKIVKINQIITYGSTKIKVNSIRVDPTKTDTGSTNKTRLFQNLLENDPKAVKILEAIEDDLLKLGTI